MTLPNIAAPRRSALPALALAVLLGACASTAPHEATRPDDESGNIATSLLLFPLNVGPNIVVDTGAMALDVVISPIVGVEPSNLFPIVILMSPIAGPLIGLADAGKGNPFWDTWAFEEYAQRIEASERADAARAIDAEEPSAD